MKKQVFASLVIVIFILHSCVKENNTGNADPNAKQHNEDAS